MPLVLQPHFTQLEREEVEARLEQVRLRRMAAAMVYYQGQQAKLEAAGTKHEKIMDDQMRLIEADLERADALMLKIEGRLEKLIEAANQFGLIQDNLTNLGR
jgi:hypothetical protein